MRSLNSFICRPKNDRRYENTKEIEGKQVVTSSTDEDHLAVNRIAIVESVPINYNGPIKDGDEIVVHHNIFRLYGDMKGRERSSYAFLFDNKFIIEPIDIFAYRRPEGKWCAIAPYCFVAPVDRVGSQGFDESGQYEPHRGVIVYPNEEQRDLNPGTEIIYRPHIEYEFNIDGKKLYRMKTHHVCLINERKS
jgi:hypothetical protein